MSSPSQDQPRDESEPRVDDVPGASAPAARREERQAEACALRRAGASLEDISAELGVSRSTAFHWTRHVLPQTPTPARARREQREAEARDLRRKGLPYKEIARQLGVSASTAYSWSHRVLLDGGPVRPVGRSPEAVQEMRRRRWEPFLRRRAQERAQAQLDAARGVAGLPPETLAVLAALAYWCEGGKSKPWERRELLRFVNSDPVLVRLFLAWLQSEGVEPQRVRLRVAIHETADVTAAERYWSEQVGVAAEGFDRVTLKRHRPTTNRKNRSAEYHGCLVVTVLGSRELYWRVEGLVVGAAHELGFLRPPGAAA